MSGTERARAWAALAAAGLPSRAIVALLRAFGSPQAVVAASPSSLAAVAGIEAAGALATRDREREDATARWLEDPAHRLVALDDPEYPAALLEAGEPPPALYVLGDPAWLSRPSIAIVGSRHATPDGEETAQTFARTLANAGFTIVSGLATGIDAAAHRGALDAAASTIAVTGTGPDRVYPASHRDLAHAIVARGSVVTPFPPGTPPLKGNFPRRNRLIATLARGVLVVEAALRSGSLITARQAADCGREVFAIPGSIHSPLSKGPHELIRQGAKLVESAQDVLDELGGVPAPAETTVAAAAHPPPATSLPPSLTRVLDSMGGGPASLDRLATRTGLPAEALASALVQLEIEGRVHALPGGRWQRRA
ncbi:MAG: DNA-processing protein DprA [Burkholderiales bacterium]